MKSIKYCFMDDLPKRKDEFKKRPCLANLVSSCRKFIKGYSGDRVCNECKDAQRKIQEV